MGKGKEDNKIKKIEEELHYIYSVPPLTYVSLEALVYDKTRRETLEMVFREIESIKKGDHNHQEHIGLHAKLDSLSSFKAGVSLQPDKSHLLQPSGKAQSAGKPDTFGERL